MPSSKGRKKVVEPASARVMQGPPWWGFAQRRRILTDDSGAVNSTLALMLAAVLAGGSVASAAPGGPPTRGELRLLVVLAGFPDRPLAKQRTHFTGRRTSLIDRLVAYYDEVSSGRLHIVPTVGRTIVTLPRARATYVQHPDAIARDTIVVFAATATEPADRAALAGAHAPL